MKIFHISDLHIGIKLYNRDLSADQEHVFKQIVDMVKEHKPDAIVIAGDIYDKSVPSVESVQLFNDFMEMLYNSCDKTEIMIISGNHDSAQRIDYLSHILERQHVHMAGIPPRQPDEYIKKVTLKDEYGKVNFYLLPFSKPSVIKGVFDTEDNICTYNEALHKLLERETIDQNERNVLVSHQFYLPIGKSAEDIERMESEITAVGNIDVVGTDVLAPFDYAALGHIHKPMTAGDGRFRYCGTPLAYSVSEANQEKGILMVDMGDKNEPVNITKLPLIPLRNVQIIEDKFENVLRQASDDYVKIILTDTEDLDVVDLHERLMLAFPNMLEIQRKHVRGLEFNDIEEDSFKKALASPYELICEFIPDMDEEEKKIIQEVINDVTFNS